MLFRLNALLCMRVACILCCGVFLQDARFIMPISSDHAGRAARFKVLHVETPQPGIRGGSGRDCTREGVGMGGAVPKRWRVSVSVACYMCYTCVSTSFRSRDSAWRGLAWPRRAPPLAPRPGAQRTSGLPTLSRSLSLTHLLACHTFAPLAICPADSSTALPIAWRSGGHFGHE